jgi:hypothetical protein
VNATIYGSQLNVPNPVSPKIEKNSDLAVNILAEKQPHEYLRDFVDQWFTPLTGIYQTMSAILGGVTGYIVAKLQKRKKSQVEGKQE